MTGYRLIVCDGCGDEARSQDGKCPNLHGWVHLDKDHSMNKLLCERDGEFDHGYEAVDHLCQSCYRRARTALRDSMRVCKTEETT